MSKRQYSIKLTGYTLDAVKAKTHQADQVTYFRNENNSVRAIVNDNDVIVTTKTGSYKLILHESIINLYTGILRKGIKAHFSKKKIVAQLIY